VNADTTIQASNFAAAINRNLSGTAVGQVVAVSSSSTVTVYSLTPGNRVSLTEFTNLPQLSFGAVTAGTNGTQANIVGFNNLYSGTTPTPFCAGKTFPTFIFSYESGVGPVITSPTISLDGTKIAYIENDSNIGAILHVLTFGSVPLSMEPAATAARRCRPAQPALVRWSPVAPRAAPRQTS
jgi:hypothetical protein